MSRHPLTGLRILIVEDNFLIASEIAHVLGDAGAVIIGPVRGAAAAVEAVRVEALDGAVLDVELDGGQTFAAAHGLARRDVPFIFVTGYRREWLPLTLTHVPLLGKPFDQHELIEAVVNCIVERRGGCGIGANQHLVDDPA